MSDAAVDPGLPAPVINRRDVVLVTGPSLAGTSSVLGALRLRLADRTVVESAELPAGDAPVAVVFVVSAVLASGVISSLAPAQPDRNRRAATLPAAAILIFMVTPQVV